MEISEIDRAHGIPIDIHTFTDEIQQVLHDVGGWIIGNATKPEPEKSYANILIQRVNINEEGSEIQKGRMRTGIIKVLGLIQKRGK